MKSLRLFPAFVYFVCFVVALHAQPTPTPSTASLTVNRTTGAITAPVIPSLFASGNSLLTISGAAAAYQPLDAELTAISGLSANGILTRTSSTTAAARTLTGTAGQITVTNGDGVSGNPTLSLPSTITQATTFSSSILGSGGTAPTNTTSGSNQFTAGIATSGPIFSGAITSTGLITGTGNASTTAALRLDNTTGSGGTAQHYANFTASGTTIARMLRGNGLAGYDSNGLNIDNFEGFQIGLNVLGGSGGSFKIRTAGTTDLLTITSAGVATFSGAVSSASATGGLGYATGAGGTVTQATSKATGVTLARVTGTITTAADALAAGAVVSFTFTNSAITATDVVLAPHVSGGTAGAYSTTVFPGAGTATVTIRNLTAGSLSEAIVLRFIVLKSVNS